MATWYEQALGQWEPSLSMSATPPFLIADNLLDGVVLFDLHDVITLPLSKTPVPPLTQLLPNYNGYIVLLSEAALTSSPLSLLVSRSNKLYESRIKKTIS